MVVVRGLGWLLLALAVAAIVHDGLIWWSEGSFHLLGLGDLWSRSRHALARRHAERGSTPPVGRAMELDRPAGPDDPGAAGLPGARRSSALARQSQRRRWRAGLSGRLAAAAAPALSRRAFLRSAAWGLTPCVRASVVLLDIVLSITYMDAAASPQGRTTHHARSAGIPPSIAQRRRLACAGAASCLGGRSGRGINQAIASFAPDPRKRESRLREMRKSLPAVQASAAAGRRNASAESRRVTELHLWVVWRPLIGEAAANPPAGIAEIPACSAGVPAAAGRRHASAESRRVTELHLWVAWRPLIGEAAANPVAGIAQIPGGA